MGRYRPMVELARILNTYRRFNLKQYFFIPGWCLETYPDTVEAILKYGHEIGHHGYLHKDPKRQLDINESGLNARWKCISAYVACDPADIARRFITSLLR